MASLSTDPKGRRMIQFMAADGKRRTIRLGKVSRRQSESVKVRVERLVAAHLTGHAVDDETARWISDLDRQMAEKLARVGLIPEVEKMCLGPFLDRYFSSRQDVKPATLTVWQHTRRNLTEFFGEGRTLKSITRGDAEEWQWSRCWMRPSRTAVWDVSNWQLLSGRGGRLPSKIERIVQRYNPGALDHGAAIQKVGVTVIATRHSKQTRPRKMVADVPMFRSRLSCLEKSSSW
ncbi:MAG: hypothetical protein CMJ45_14625 [Planctomyces sp.]|nr:hypothetical protein [Planctomyces sp.]